jgi:hypothetical protein
VAAISSSVEKLPDGQAVVSGAHKEQGDATGTYGVAMAGAQDQLAIVLLVPGELCLVALTRLGVGEHG